MRIEQAGFAPQMAQQSLGFKRQLAAERLRPKRAVEQEDAWRPQICRGELVVIGLGQRAVHQVRQMGTCDWFIHSTILEIWKR
ncbi:hypothetical protein [Stenotrophomonas maltophilia]|uniref:hypothetical protein n=1 Tax=Stenotrophomonas maltophilia TaxID=40324 RepID=UPI002158B4DB|nr:hypothetical protein [Stenotrophomonas maltophilia]